MKDKQIISFFFTNKNVTTIDVNASDANDVFENICKQMQRGNTGTVVLNDDQKRVLINLGNVDQVKFEK